MIGTLVDARMLLELRRRRCRTVFEGIAKPMPCAYADVTVDWLMPITRPSMSIERAAGVAGVDRRRGLQQAFEVDLAAVAAVRDRLVAVEAGDDADGHRLLEFERFADRDRPLSLLEAVGVGRASSGGGSFA